MKRVAIVGNGGGGKSTLARRLSESYGLPWHSVDQVQWLPGWVAAPSEEVAMVVDSWADGAGWIIDGWGPWTSIERRLEAADTIVFVDLPLWMHFWLAAERQIAVAKGDKRADPVEGCDDLQVTKRLFETIWRVDQEYLPRLRKLIDQFRREKRLIHVTSLEAIAAIR